MRVKIELIGKQVRIPINYQSLLQGLIYSMFDKKEYGFFLHEKGYRLDEKVFKMFVFSNLYGKYQIVDHDLIFEDKIYFYVASPVEEFVQNLYQFFINNERVLIGNNILKISKVSFVDAMFFTGEKDVIIKTISPVVVYKTVGKFVNYIQPSDEEFETYCYRNLCKKNDAYKSIVKELVFKINEVKKQRKRIVHFKNTFYLAYDIELSIHTNYETLSFLLDTGLSSKGSAGFGMVVVQI